MLCLFQFLCKFFPFGLPQLYYLSGVFLQNIRYFPPLDGVFQDVIQGPDLLGFDFNSAGHNFTWGDFHTDGGKVLAGPFQFGGTVSGLSVDRFFNNSRIYQSSGIAVEHPDAILRELFVAQPYWH